jgi:hypothetical protein
LLTVGNGVVDTIALRDLLIAKEHHRGAPVLQLAGVRLGRLDMRDAAKDPQVTHLRFLPMPCFIWCSSIYSTRRGPVQKVHRNAYGLHPEP